MKKLLSILAFLFVTYNYGQTFSQTFVDRCTGEVQVVTANFSNGSAVVAFYDEVKLFTYTEFTNGTLQSWLVAKYNWWQALSPCSQAQQQTQTAQNAANNASNAASNASNTTQNSGSTNTGGTTSGSSGSTSSDSTSSGSSSSGSSSSGSSSGGSTEGSSGSSSGGDSGGNSDSGGGDSSSDNNSGDNSGDSSDNGYSAEDSNNNTEGDNNGESEGQGDSDGSEGSSEESDTEGSGEDSSEESSETDSEESGEGSEESDSEDSESDEVEEESEEESEEEGEEESKEESDDSEEDEEEKERRMNPIQLRADLMQQQALTLEYNSVLNIGASQTSIYGDRSYNLNGMIWDNLRQFGLSFSTSVVSMTKDYEVSWVDGVNVSYMRNYTMNAISFGANRMKPMGKYGTVGIGINYAYMFGKDALGDKMPDMYSLGYNFLYTNSFQLSPRINYAPAFIVAQNPLTVQQGTEWKTSAITNNDVMGILSNSFTVQFTKRFSLNLGWTVIASTNEFLPIMNSFMIGSKIPF